MHDRKNSNSGNSRKHKLSKLQITWEDFDSLIHVEGQTSISLASALKITQRTLLNFIAHFTDKRNDTPLSFSIIKDMALGELKEALGESVYQSPMETPPPVDLTSLSLAEIYQYVLKTSSKTALSLWFGLKLSVVNDHLSYYNTSCEKLFKYKNTGLSLEEVSIKFGDDKFSMSHTELLKPRPSIGSKTVPSYVKKSFLFFQSDVKQNKANPMVLSHSDSETDSDRDIESETDTNPDMESEIDIHPDMEFEDSVTENNDPVVPLPSSEDKLTPTAPCYFESPSWDTVPSQGLTSDRGLASDELLKSLMTPTFECAWYRFHPAQVEKTIGPLDLSEEEWQFTSTGNNTP